MIFLYKHCDKLKLIINPIIKKCTCLKNQISKLNCNCMKKYFKRRVLKKKEKENKKFSDKMKKMGINMDFDSLS